MTLQTQQPTSENAPAVLTEDQRRRVAHALESAQSENTRKNYASQFGKFRSWCELEGYAPLPAQPEVLATYAALTPASSEFDGKVVALKELVRREGQVLLSASPDLSPERHRMDIIGLDDSVALRLPFNHAASNSEAAQRARI